MATVERGQRLALSEGDEVVLVPRAGVVVHGELPLWDLPPTEAEGQRVGRHAGSGDVHEPAAEVVSVPRVPVPAGGRRFGRDALRAERAAGEMVLSPVAAQALADSPQWEVSDWEIVPGLRMLAVRTPTLPPATHTNVFLVGTERLVLIEPAPVAARERARILAWIRAQRGRDGRPLVLERILATHHHHDHVGGAAALVEELGAPLFAHEATAARLSVAAAHLRDGQRVRVDEELELVCIHTPGHAPGHLCFLEPRSGVMIVGDMVAGVGTIVVDPHEGDMVEYLASLARLRDLAPRWLLPAHGGLIADPRAHLDHYVAHRLDRERRVHAALEVDYADLDALVVRAYPDVPPAVWPLAKLSLEAHLQKLAHDGRAERRGSEWRRRGT